MASLASAPALPLPDFLRSVDATRATLGKSPMKLLDLVEHVRSLTHGAPYAVLGGLAQILWARKSHTDDLDVALASTDIASALRRVQQQEVAGWSEPKPPDLTQESDDVFEVCHLLHGGAVVDLIAFRNEAFNSEILRTARPVDELGGVLFIRPELLVVTHLLRPGPEAALAAIELVISRRKFGGLDANEARTWAANVGRLERFERVLEQADAMSLL
jgi:hypothetical protein